MNPIDLGLACGLDSLVAGCAIGLWTARWSDRLRWAFAFGAWDAAACWVGGHAPIVVGGGVQFALCAGTVALALASRWLFGLRYGLLWLPPALAIDNLAAPAAGWIVGGFGSASMAFAGLAVAAALRRALCPSPITKGPAA